MIKVVIITIGEEIAAVIFNKSTDIDIKITINIEKAILADKYFNKLS